MTSSIEVLQTENYSRLISEIALAREKMEAVDCPVLPTEIIFSERLSQLYQADIWLASEVNQVTGAYKIRGAYNRMISLSSAEKREGVVTASAGNHAQGVAWCANYLRVAASIYMPLYTPTNKVTQTKNIGGGYVDICLFGNTFDDAYREARIVQQNENKTFIHPFDDEKVIAGQGTIGLEIGESLGEVDVLFCPVGGGGLLSGVGTVLRSKYPQTELIGVEPVGAASLSLALKHGLPARIPGEIDTFVDGASVKQIGNRPYHYFKKLGVRAVAVDNCTVRSATTHLWENEGVPIKAELAGALAIAGLSKVRDLKNKSIVCLVTGGNLSEKRYFDEVKIVV